MPLSLSSPRLMQQQSEHIKTAPNTPPLLSVTGRFPSHAERDPAALSPSVSPPIGPPFLDGFHLLAIVKSAAINLSVQIAESLLSLPRALWTILLQ